MDLIPQVECRRCGTEYSSLQSRCPKCGARKMKQTQRAPGTTSGTVAGTYANDQAQVNTRWQMTFAAILVVAVILAMIVLISTSLNTAPGGADVQQQGGNSGPVQVGDTTPTPPPTITPSPTPMPEITGLELQYAGKKITEFTEAVGRETPLTLIYYPMNVPVQAGDITWSSDNESVCTVVGDTKGCVITNHGTGKAVVTVSLFGKTTTVTVYGRESW